MIPSPGLNMAISHFTALVLFAFFVSVVFAILSRDTPRAQVMYGLKVFLSFVGIALALAWLMYPFPR